MFLHIVAADTKFLWRLHQLLESVAPGMNEFVAVGPTDEHFVLPEGVTLAPTIRDVQDVLRSRPQWDGVVLNGLSFPSLGPIVPYLPTNVRVAWYVWGFEAYGHWRPLASSLLMPETQRLLDRLSGPWWKRRLRSVLKRTKPTSRASRRLVDRLDYCVTPLKEEYDLFVASGMPRKVEFHWGLVGSLEQTVDVDSAPGAGEDIQLGNSAFWPNNHLEALRILSGPQSGGRKVITPLSYGDPQCRETVVTAGRGLLGDRFQPLVGFLPLDDYHRVVKVCGHVVMNHMRQQALGNILAALWRGSRVYMNDTTAYRGLRRYGFDVRLIGKDIAAPDVRGLSAQPERQTQLHRELLTVHFGYERVAAETRDLLERLAR